MYLGNKDEPILEPIFRKLRFAVAYKDLKKILKETSVILDYGCGSEAKFHSYLESETIDFKLYCGFDPLWPFSDWSNIKKHKFDLVTMFAVIEHLPYPDFDFGPIIEQMKAGGYLMLTTPTKIVKPLLEFLSYNLGVVSRREIEEHQHYFNLKEIETLFGKYGLRVVNQKIFELGMNNYVLLRRSK
jgi:hypothetical protein